MRPEEKLTVERVLELSLSDISSAEIRGGNDLESASGCEENLLFSDPQRQRRMEDETKSLRRSPLPRYAKAIIADTGIEIMAVTLPLRLLAYALVTVAAIIGLCICSFIYEKKIRFKLTRWVTRASP
ncbi:unnamed protein product [Vitrella brassicaformis CCMP3155]|uniref:Uncharacterized protein n=1 Tax=Vitrella brassicaformis (strain CCMP3155) TaxID=1169540 RepID=A0A0G4E9C3_VITBC|nr:unnamed protein product [Vitrella brassicaformis CCMP3155]|eukprot:CEL91968.1 unnamed protein product [Vitrella brassicaformis CCMP3155]